MHGEISSDVIRSVCNEEQIAYLESSRSENPKLEGAARALRDICKVTQKQVSFSHLEDMASVLKIEIWSADEKHFPPNVDGIVIGFVDDDDEYKCYIIVRKGLTRRAAKFCIAHEIGHVVLNHSPMLATQAMESFSSFRHYQQNEFEANHIAGALLMDEYLLKKDLKKSPDDPIDLERLCDNYAVSYETVAYRFAVVSDLKIHFLKIDADGNVVKRLARSTESVNWIAMKKFCRQTAARKVIDGRESTRTQISRITDGDKEKSEKLFCFSKRVQKPSGTKFSITIGCKLDDAGHFAAFQRLDDVYEIHEVSSFSCGPECMVRSCEHIEN